MSFTLGDRFRSIRFALRGMRSMLASQHNAWIHAAASIVIIAAGIFCRLDRIEWCFIVIAIMAVWAAEAMNTALEFLCDVASPEFHPLVEKAKDVAAAGVLIVAIGAIVIGLLVLGPHLRSY
jgi:diacylglycerol kinase (ATP)